MNNKLAYDVYDKPVWGFRSYGKANNAGERGKKTRGTKLSSRLNFFTLTRVIRSPMITESLEQAIYDIYAMRYNLSRLKMVRV